MLKVQHHGSEHNMDIAFAKRVSADHYVFCGNGEHGNPELRVIDIIFNSRLGKPEVRALAPEAKDRKFHFWFSTTSSALPENTEKHKSFVKIENKAAQLATESNGLLELHFNQSASTVLKI